MHLVAYVLAALAVVIMGVNVVLAIRLRRAIVGGEVGSKWGLMTGLIVVFFLGYLFAPLALYFSLPEHYVYAMAFGVFLFGAIFVFVVIGIIRDTLAFLKLLK